MKITRKSFLGIFPALLAVKPPLLDSARHLRNMRVTPRYDAVEYLVLMQSRDLALEQYQKAVNENA